MKLKIAVCVLLILLLSVFTMNAENKELRVITDRTETHLKDLFDYYFKKTGINVKAVYLESGLLARLESRPTEADIVMTSTCNLLETAKNKDLLGAFTSPQIVSKVNANYLDAKHFYFVTSYRARAIFYSKDRVKASELSTYEDLASPIWKGRIAIRSGYHEYNLCFFSQLAITDGLEKAKAFITGLHANLARKPSGNDREQARAIYEGKADIAIVNSYYMGIMLSTEEQKAWGLSAKVFFPNQNDKGSYILCSGVALTKSGKTNSDAVKFLEFLADDYAQVYFTNKLNEYSINDKLPITEVNKALGSDQKEVVDGRFKINYISIAEIEKNRSAIIKILDEINFDDK
jgi:iron(III) transport system substrate-binding protein